MKNAFGFLFAAALALVAVTSVSRASIVSTVNGTVSYTPPSFVFEGTLSATAPLTESYQLVVESPSTLVPGVAIPPVTLQVTSTATPSGVAPATAAAFLTLSTNSLSFTGPNQSVQITVTLTIPPGSFAGNYAWAINSSGWPLTIGTVIDGIGGLGTTVNANISPATTAPQTPTVTISAPTPGQVFTLAPGSATAPVPYALSGSTPNGSVFSTASSATLTLVNAAGTAVAGFAPTFSLSAPNGATTVITTAGTVNLPAGTYTLSGTVTNSTGTSAVAAPVTFTVTGPPTVTITAPSIGAVYTVALGGATAPVPYAITASTQAGSTFPTSGSASATLTLNGAAVAGFAPAFTGAGTAAIAASGTINLAPGVYTLSATATNSGGLVGTAAAVTFTVNPPPAPAETLVWLGAGNGFGGGPCGGNGGGSSVTQQSVTGGSVVPLTFGLYTGGGANPSWGGRKGSSGTFVTDATTLIAIYEVLPNNATTAPLIFTYGANGPNPPFYSIGTSAYLLNFPTAGGTHHYTVEVYHPVGSTLQLLGTDDVYTRGNCLPGASAQSARFNSAPIGAGSTLWFSSVVNVRGLSCTASTLLFDSAVITFTVRGTQVTVPVPAAVIQFDPAATTASTVFNASSQTWVTIVPVGYTGDVFLSGVAYAVPSALPGNLSGVTWSGYFRSNTCAVAANWKWAAAVYSQFASSLSGIAVKPVDAINLSAYLNSDLAGSPENYKAGVVAGALGLGGANLTGTYTNGSSPNLESDYWGSSGWSGDQDGDHSGDGRDGGCGLGF